MTWIRWSTAEKQTIMQWPCVQECDLTNMVVLECLFLLMGFVYSLWWRLSDFSHFPLWHWAFDKLGITLSWKLYCSSSFLILETRRSCGSVVHRVFRMTSQNKATQSVCLTFNFSIYFSPMSLSDAVTLKVLTSFEMADLLLWVQDRPAHRSCSISFSLSPFLTLPWWWDGVVKATCFCADQWKR